jgi:hypothetical protein
MPHARNRQLVPFCAAIPKKQHATLHEDALGWRSGSGLPGMRPVAAVTSNNAAVLNATSLLAAVAGILLVRH